MVIWDSRSIPTTRCSSMPPKSRHPLIVFATSEFTAEELDEALEQLEGLRLPPRRARDLERASTELRAYEASPAPRTRLRHRRPSSTSTNSAPTGTRSSSTIGDEIDTPSAQPRTTKTKTTLGRLLLEELTPGRCAGSLLDPEPTNARRHVWPRLWASARSAAARPRAAAAIRDPEPPRAFLIPRLERLCTTPSPARHAAAVARALPRHRATRDDPALRRLRRRRHHLRRHPEKGHRARRRHRAAFTCPTASRTATACAPKSSSRPRAKASG